MPFVDVPGKSRKTSFWWHCPFDDHRRVPRSQAESWHWLLRVPAQATALLCPRHPLKYSILAIICLFACTAKDKKIYIFVVCHSTKIQENLHFRGVAHTKMQENASQRRYNHFPSFFLCLTCNFQSKSGLQTTLHTLLAPTPPATAGTLSDTI